MRRWTIFISLLVLVSSTVWARPGTHERNKNSQQVERIAAADSRVLVTACVVSGGLTVNSWDRNEVRARISDGVQIELTRIDQSKSKLAGELKLTASDARANRRESCLTLGDIELTVPRGASVKLQTTSGEITATGVARVEARSQSGAIEVSRVHDEINANTISGEIVARDSTGAIRLHTIGGSIEARSLSETSATDSLEVSTISGDITLARINHQRVRANTTSGEIDYSGPLARGGHYSFQGISGKLLLSLPPDSSFRISGTLGAGGGMTSDFPLKDNAPAGRRSPSMRTIDSIIGTGDASISISFFSGSIHIKKQ